MEQLWAPWRMAYIKRAPSPDEPGCFLCSYASRRDDEATYVLSRSEHCFAVLNLYPYNPGHLMVAPYAHVPSIEDLDTSALTDLMTLSQRMLAALRATMQPDGFNMGINQGKVAGAGLAEHVHLHIVPRWNGDTNFMPVLGDVKVIPDLLANTYQQLRAAIEAQRDAYDAAHPAEAQPPTKGPAKSAKRAATRTRKAT
jgi:ATP adenylyltransferase